MTDEENNSNQWKIVEFGKRILRFISNSVVAPILVLLVLIPGTIIGYTLDVTLGLPLGMYPSIAIGIWIFLLILVFILAILSYFNVKDIRETLLKADKLFEGIDNRFVFSVHVFIYGAVFSGVFVLIVFAGAEFAQALNSKVQSDPQLSAHQVEVATTSLQTLGLLIPIWIGIVNIGVRAYFENRTQNRRDFSISAHELITVGSVGYTLLVVSFSFIVWALLPIMTDMVANGMFVLLTGLAFVGVHFITLDRGLREQNNEGSSPPYIQ